MYPRRTPNFVTASMLHEIRMVAQEFFHSREGRKILRPKYTEVVNNLPLECCFCLEIRKNVNKANTIIDGYAVCFEHALSPFVRSPDFLARLHRIKEAEIK